MTACKPIRKSKESDTATQELVKRVCEIARNTIDPAVLERTRKRHAAVFRWEEADSIPVKFNAPHEELAALEIPTYDWEEMYYEPAKSFVFQMKGVIAAAAAGSDSLYSMRADMGVVNGPSVFGAKFSVPKHTKTIVNEYVPKEALADFTVPDDIRHLGTMPMVIEHTQHHLEALRTHGLEGLVTVHHCDQQGPFDIAEQSRGHDMLTDFYEDPEFVHHLMRQATRAYIAISRLCKEIQGEPLRAGNAVSNYMDPGGVRMCDDSGILVSPPIFEEFIQPYQIEAFEHFGGGWLHYCGGVPGGGRSEGLHLHDLYLSNPYLRGLNFTTGKDLDAEIRKVVGKKVNYIGGYPRREGESLEDYARRICSLLDGRRGMILSLAVTDGEKPHAMETWMKVQDEVFGA